MSVGQGDAPSGGGSSDAQAAVVSALQQGASDRGDQGTAPAGQSPQARSTQQAPSGTATPEGSGLVSPFLEGVAPEDRAIVEKYIKDWDGGVTKKFQELHGELGPYKELGADPQTLGQAVQLMEMIDNDPQGVVDLLQQALQENGQGPQGQEEQQQQPGGEDPMSALPPEFVEKFKQMEQVLEALAGNHIQQETDRTNAQEDQQLASTLDSLKQEFGEFDEEYVLAKMFMGTDPKEAVAAYNKAIQGQVNSRAAAPNVPAILGGGGAAPQSGGFDPTKASSKDVRNLVASVLSKTAQS